MLTLLERRLLNEFQHGLPLTETPWQDMAEQLNCSEQEVLHSFKSLQQRGMVSRVGAVLAHNKIGASTLAALAVVDETEITRIAEIINQFDEVNHNYQRSHHYNLWFVVTASCQQEVDRVLEEIAQQTGLEVLNLPMEKAYHIDLGFPLWC